MLITSRWQCIFPLNYIHTSANRNRPSTLQIPYFILLIPEKFERSLPLSLFSKSGGQFLPFPDLLSHFQISNLLGRQPFLAIRGRLAEYVLAPPIRVEIRAHRVRVVLFPGHEIVRLVRVVEIVHLQLDLVPVEVAVVHARRGAVVDAPQRQDRGVAVLQVHVLVRECGERRVREGDVVQAGVRDVLWFGDRVGRADDGDAVVFVVVRQKGQHGVLVHDVRVEQVAVELDHGFVVGRRGSKDDVREDPGCLADDGFTVLRSSSLCPWCCGSD